MGGVSANFSAREYAEAPPTPDPSPPRAARAGGGEKITYPTKFWRDRARSYPFNRAMATPSRAS
jgi:hypothetical protein